MNKYVLLLLAVLLFMSGCASNFLKVPLTTFTLQSWGQGAPSLKLELPQTFSMNKRDGADFDVFSFSNGADDSTLGIYVGYAPRRLSKGVDEKNIQHRTRWVGTNSVVWTHWMEQERYHGETVVTNFFNRADGKTQSGLLLHVFVASTNRTEVARLEKAAETLQGL